MDADRRIVAIDVVPTDSTLLVTLRPHDFDTVDATAGDVGEAADGTPEIEVLLIQHADGVAAYRNHCQHWTDIRLDKGDGAFVRNDEIFCQKHGATFESDTGYCNFGPCEGAVLESVDVSVVDDAVYLTDDRFSVVRVGPAERDEDSSGSRIDFTGS